MAKVKTTTTAEGIADDDLQGLLSEVAGDDAVSDRAVGGAAAEEAALVRTTRLAPALEKTLDRGFEQLGKEARAFRASPTKQTRAVVVERLTRMIRSAGGEAATKEIGRKEMRGLLSAVQEGRMLGGNAKEAGARLTREALAILPTRAGVLAEAIDTRAAQLAGASTRVVGKTAQRGFLGKVGRVGGLALKGAGSVGGFFAGDIAASALMKRLFAQSTAPEAARLAAEAEQFGSSPFQTNVGAALSAASTANPTILDMIAADPDLASAIAREGVSRAAASQPVQPRQRSGTLALMGGRGGQPPSVSEFP